MGKQARDNRDQALKTLDTMIGDVQAFNVHKYSGCPKCQTPQDRFIRKWCPGRDVPGANGICQKDGQHLHVQCSGCSFMWVEETADADSNREAIAKSLITPP